MLCLTKLGSNKKHCATTSLEKVSLLEVGVYLIRQIQNSLFIDPNNQMESEVQKALIFLIMAFFFHLLTNNYCQGDFF